jgi:anti-sigma regulatory factor (Ser/Thr protein kinase)
MMLEDKEAGARRELTSEAVARGKVALSELLNNTSQLSHHYCAS